MFIFLITSYLFFTIEEWAIHKYILHENKNHLLHHKNHIEYICVDVVSLNAVIQGLLVVCINTGILYLLFNSYISLFVIMVTVTLFLVTNVIVWNICHPIAHDFKSSHCSCSSSSSSSSWSSYFYSSYVKWSIANHKAHHINPNCNYNVVYPGADYLFGTNNKTNFSSIK